MQQERKGGRKRDSAKKHLPVRDATFNLKQHQNDLFYLLDPVHHQTKKNNSERFSIDPRLKTRKSAFWAQGLWKLICLLLNVFSSKSNRKVKPQRKRFKGIHLLLLLHNLDKSLISCTLNLFLYSFIHPLSSASASACFCIIIINYIIPNPSCNQDSWDWLNILIHNSYCDEEARITNHLQYFIKSCLPDKNQAMLEW